MLVSFAVASENLCDGLVFYPQNIRSEHDNRPSQVTVHLRLEINIFE